MDGSSSPLERILCVKIASRGDLLLAGPAFAEVRERRPGSEITLLVGESCVDVARHLPYFDEIVTLDDRALLAGTPIQRVRAAIRLFGTFRRWSGRNGSRRAGTTIYILHRDRRYGLVARLAGIQTRVGFGSGRVSHVTHAYEPPEEEHHSLQYLSLIRLPWDTTGAQVFEPPPLAGTWRFLPGELEAGSTVAKQYGFDAERGPCIALGFGGGRNVKNRTELKSWPLDRYVELANRLTERGWRVAWLGDADDATRLGPVPVGIRLAGRLSVAESAVVLRQCVLTVANDTLLTHLSEAVGTPTIGIFGPTDPKRYGPTGSRSLAIWKGDSMACSPCEVAGSYPPCAFGHACMEAVSVEAVLAAVTRVVAEVSPPPLARMSSGR